jgi:hypothetical protein
MTDNLGEGGKKVVYSRKAGIHGRGISAVSGRAEGTLEGTGV